ncbi:MAG: hypothetical protein HWN80_19250 [Candidatus Lokiarchaeota archaeon]|nr:hypothetical protein [Candidatus Lokiarchaeota archaeon]
MTKIYCYYTILNPKEVYNPNDKISGIFYIENKEKEGSKDRLLKKIEIQLMEIYQERVSYEQKSLLTGEMETKYKWVNHQKKLQKYYYKKKYPIKPGEIKEFEFEMPLPKTWSPKVSGNLKDWHLALLFKQKTGMKLSLGKSPNTAYYVIPVQHSARPGSSPSIAGEKEEKSVILKEVEKHKLQKLANLVQISSKININDISEILKLKRTIILEKLIEWAGKYSLNIEGDYLVINEDKKSEFISALKSMIVCPYCLSEIEIDIEMCPHCGVSLQEEE